MNPSNPSRSTPAMAVLLRILAAIALSTQLASCASDPSHVSGHVLDVTTKEPVEGAYVLMTYFGSGGVYGGHMGSWCTATAGMYTGKDGAFNFPYETKSGARGRWAYAVKPGYFFKSEGGAFDYRGREKLSNIYNDWQVFLVKQEEKDIVRDFKRFECDRPASAEAVASNFKYLEITLAEQYRIKHTEERITITLDFIEGLRAQLRFLASQK